MMDPKQQSNEERESRLSRFIERPRRAVWTMAAPMMAGMMVHTAYIIVDAAFIGWVGDHALAAITFVFPLVFVLIAITNGLSTAITALVAQAIGRQDLDEADRIATSGLMVTVLVGAVFAAGGLLSGPSLLRILGANGASWHAAWAYFSVLAAGVPLFFIGGTLRAILTGEGDAKTPMVLMGIGTLVNLGLDALLIVVLKLGIAGAAWATLTAQTLTLLGFAYVLFVRRKGTVRLRARHIGFHGPLLRGLLVLGLPTAAGQLVMALGMAMANRVLSHFGQIAVAAYGAASKVDMIVAMPIMGLAAAAVAVIGMFAGAGRVDLVRATSLYTIRWALILAVVVGTAGYLLAGPIIGIFIDKPAALSIGRTYLGFMVFAYPLMAFGITSGRILQGLGYGVPSLVITSLRVLVVAVPAAYLAVYLFGAPIEAIWAAMISGGLVANITGIIWIRHLVWKRDPALRAQAEAGAS
jgi:putative MATE family efflux protein